jgi:hypothetical protein
MQHNRRRGRHRRRRTRGRRTLTVGGASAPVTFICVLCNLRTQISRRSICNYTHYRPVVRFANASVAMSGGIGGSRTRILAPERWETTQAGRVIASRTQVRFDEHVPYVCMCFGFVSVILFSLVLAPERSETTQAGRVIASRTQVSVDFHVP